jgi:hypothetical protein
MLLSNLDLRANEITLDATGLSECTYAADLNIEPVMLLKNELFTHFPETLSEDQSTWDILGKTESDGLNYFEPTISLTYKDPPDSTTKAKWNIPANIQCVDCYTVKFQLHSKKKVLKVYEDDFANHTLPALPAASRVIKSLGIGRHFHDGLLANNRDVYFFHQSQEEVEHFFSRSLPTLPWDKAGSRRLFGLCYDISSREIRKLKRYIYPQDLHLDHPENV